MQWPVVRLVRRSERNDSRGRRNGVLFPRYGKWSLPALLIGSLITARNWLGALDGLTLVTSPGMLAVWLVASLFGQSKGPPSGLAYWFEAVPTVAIFWLVNSAIWGGIVVSM